MMQPDSKNRPPTAQTAEPQSDDPWLKKAREAYESSTTYIDTNFRKQWEDGIRAFNSQHPADSKYNGPAYEKRSKLYRPKNRAVIRKNEAATAAAFFSNMDQVTIAAEDQSNKAQLASADVMKAIVQYRMGKSIPWFQFVLGGVQDAQVTGTVCGHAYWDYKYTKKEEDVEVETEIGPEDPEYPTQDQLPEGAWAVGAERPQVTMVKTEKREIITPICDRPCLKLLPVENIRIDPAANWMDPVNSSPYFIELMPMYVMDVKKKISSGEWLDPGEQAMANAMSTVSDSTRAARQKDRDDPQTSDTRAYDEIGIIWVHRHIHRDEDHQDWDFYTLGTEAMLTEPKKLEETVFFNMRPYVLGTFILEAHRIMSSGVPVINRPLQDESNEITNQRIDNVKFAMNKRWFAKRGKNVDTTGLVRNVPGSVVMMEDPTNDVREISTPDVTASAYEEQRGLDLLQDELLGNFNPAALMANGGANAPARNMAMLNQSNGTLVEYGIRTYVETFIQPILRMLIKLEQYYETDTVVMALAGKNAQLFQKYGVDQVTDDLLNQELTLSVNVGMGATDPTQKLQKFLTAINSFAGVLKLDVPAMNLGEVGKEIFAHLGYSDASRFFTVDDPNVASLQAKLQKAQQMIQQLEGKVKEKQTAQVVGLQKTRETNQTKLQIAGVQEDAANTRALATHIAAITEADHQRKHERILKPKR